MTHINRDRFNTPLIDLGFNIAAGECEGYKVMSAMGERDNIETTATGEDISPLSATTIPVPSSSGERISIVSTDADDTLLGNGLRQIEIEYLDGDGLEQQEVIDMAGQTPVHTVATDITFINDCHAVTVGDTGVSEGTVSVYKFGAASTIYNQLGPSGNKSLVITRKVPSDKTFFVTGWTVGVNGGKLMSLRLRATSDDHGQLREGAFLFKRSLKTGGDSAFSEVVNPPVQIPSNAIIKVTAWAEGAGNDVSVSFNGILKDNIITR